MLYYELQELHKRAMLLGDEMPHFTDRGSVAPYRDFSLSGETPKDLVQTALQCSLSRARLSNKDVLYGYRSTESVCIPGRDQNLGLDGRHDALNILHQDVKVQRIGRALHHPEAQVETFGLLIFRMSHECPDSSFF